MISRRILASCAAAFLMGVSALVPHAQAQDRPVTIIVPFAPGGGNDIIARELGRQLIDTIKANVIIDNRSGAGGLIAAKNTAAAAPNGQTLMFVSSSVVTTAAVRKQEPYNIAKDFTAIAMIGRGPFLVVASNDSRLNSVKDVVTRSKDKPGSLNFVSSGVGSILHLSTELFMKRAGITMTHVPYSGSGPALMDLVAGRADLFITTVPVVSSHVQEKTLNLLAVTSDERSPLFPNAPTLAESGVAGGGMYTLWGIVGPPNMAPDLVAHINKAVNDAAASPAMVKRFAEEGATPYRGTPKEFAKVLEKERDTWRRVVEDGNLYTN
jgi:tripartite-type tricarboxylate transporter receptor subunit TctC